MKLHNIKQLLQENHDEEDGYDWGDEEDEYDEQFEEDRMAEEEALADWEAQKWDAIHDAVFGDGGGSFLSFVERQLHAGAGEYSVDFVDFQNAKAFENYLESLAKGGTDPKGIRFPGIELVIDNKDEEEPGFYITLDDINAINNRVWTFLENHCGEKYAGDWYLPGFSSSVGTQMANEKVNLIKSITITNVNQEVHNTFDVFSQDQIFSIQNLPKCIDGSEFTIKFENCTGVWLCGRDFGGGSPTFVDIPRSAKVSVLMWSGDKGINIKERLNGRTDISCLAIQSSYKDFEKLSGLSPEEIVVVKSFDYRVLGKPHSDIVVYDPLQAGDNLTSLVSYAKRFSQKINLQLVRYVGDDYRLVDKICVKSGAALYYLLNEYDRGRIEITSDDANEHILDAFRDLLEVISDNGLTVEGFDEWFEEEREKYAHVFIQD